MTSTGYLFHSSYLRLFSSVVSAVTLSKHYMRVLELPACLQDVCGCPHLLSAALVSLSLCLSMSVCLSACLSLVLLRLQVYSLVPDSLRGYCLYLQLWKHKCFSNKLWTFCLWTLINFILWCEGPWLFSLPVCEVFCPSTSLLSGGGGAFSFLGLAFEVTAR